tara:strand:+ start:548 stop:718 length:171 start_codon:yes stop_codon:yes gene_type:complete
MIDYKKRLDEQYQEIFRHKSKQGLTILTEQEAVFIRAVMRLQPQGETSEQINKITN